MLAAVLVLAPAALAPSHCLSSRHLVVGQRQSPKFHRSGPCALALTEDELTQAKASLVKGLLYNKVISPKGVALVDELVANAPPVPGDVVWWLGRYHMQSSHLLASALKAVGGWRLLDGAPLLVVVSGAEGSHVEIETDLLVLGCDTGIRFLGSLQRGLLPGDDLGLLRVTIDQAEFFEPSDEFGITKALNKCEGELRPVLPSEESPVSATFRPVYVDEEMVILREKESAATESEPMLIVLSRLAPADGDDLKAGMEMDDDYT